MATVRMYSPTGNGIVVNVLDVEKKLQEGYKTEEAWKAEQAIVSQQKHQEWLTSPDTIEERKMYLIQARNARLAEYDTAVSQLQRLIVITSNPTTKASYETLLNEWYAYAEALCALPDNPNAPFDGGGSLTPWPTKPMSPTAKARSTSASNYNVS